MYLHLRSKMFVFAGDQGINGIRKKGEMASKTAGVSHDCEKKDTG